MTEDIKLHPQLKACHANCDIANICYVYSKLLDPITSALRFITRNDAESGIYFTRVLHQIACACKFYRGDGTELEEGGV